MVETLISDQNPLLKEVRRLGKTGTASPDRSILAEGPRLLDEALRSGVEIRAVILAESAGEMAEPARFGGARVVRVPDALFARIASTEAPQGVLALVRAPEWTQEDLLKGTPLLVVLDGIQEPGNAGAILRAAEAFSATGAVFLKGTVNPYNPKALRASAGSVFRLPLVVGSAIPPGLAVYAADARAPLTLSEANFREQCAIVIGGEGSGVTPGIAARSTPVRIPTAKVESLNAAVAAGILLYEARRQRGHS